MLLYSVLRVLPNRQHGNLAGSIGKASLGATAACCRVDKTVVLKPGDANSGSLQEQVHDLRLYI
jgi:hypothetical protein